MLISIITVCFNEQDNIKRTMESILSQNEKCFEYIICDGGSTDDTLCIIEETKKKYKDINIRVISKKDGGIYYGMNNGIEYANGDYILFINAGDQLHDTNVISSLVSEINDKSQIIYGNCVFVEKDIEKEIVCDDSKLLQDMTVCHPAVLVPTSIMKERRFNTSYKIAADYEYLVYLKTSGFQFKHIERYISYFFYGGVCTSDFKKSMEERCRIWNEYEIDYDEINQKKLTKKYYLINYLKGHIPLELWFFWNEKVKKRKRFRKERER